MKEDKSLKDKKLENVNGGGASSPNHTYYCNCGYHSNQRGTGNCPNCGAKLQHKIWID